MQKVMALALCGFHFTVLIKGDVTFISHTQTPAGPWKCGTPRHNKHSRGQPTRDCPRPGPLPSCRGILLCLKLLPTISFAFMVLKHTVLWLYSFPPNPSLLPVSPTQFSVFRHLPTRSCFLWVLPVSQWVDPNSTSSTNSCKYIPFVSFSAMMKSLIRNRPVSSIAS